MLKRILSISFILIVLSVTLLGCDKTTSKSTENNQKEDPSSETTNSISADDLTGENIAWEPLNIERTTKGLTFNINVGIRDSYIEKLSKMNSNWYVTISDKSSTLTDILDPKSPPIPVKINLDSPLKKDTNKNIYSVSLNGGLIENLSENQLKLALDPANYKLDILNEKQEVVGIFYDINKPWSF
ncbi:MULTISPECIES: hypothetical protein [Bacillaceae]|uniref:hypothetical protein n=1 Tax=Bacillaceae TaxID=186817 RepID=UPI001E49F2DD|nr:hypothetical protein [Bacillus sp. Au-Bac7]MCE4052051.1 hypothetical protein [Bacillus sp. Au-Bac7]